MDPMDVLRSNLSRVRIPEPTNRIYKQECCLTFDTPVLHLPHLFFRNDGVDVSLAIVVFTLLHLSLSFNWLMIFFSLTSQTHFIVFLYIVGFDIIFRHFTVWLLRNRDNL